MAKGSRGVEIMRFRGVPLELDASWLIIAALITLSLRAQFGLNLPGSSSVALWVAAAFGAILFFVSVLVHELSHSVMALRRGIGVRRIRLFIFGGVSELEGEADTPADELAVTIVGPLSSLGLAALFYLSSLAFEPISALATTTVRWLAGVNLLLGLFNLVPGFPLDGGRVLRAIVWSRTKNRRRATDIAVTGGKLVAWALIALGVFFIVTGSFAGLWYAFLGFYLLRAADAAGRYFLFDEMLHEVIVEQVMRPLGPEVSPALPLLDFRDSVLMAGTDTAYPVVDPWGRLVGVVGLADLRRIPGEQWETTNVGGAMRPVDATETAAADSSVLPLITRLGGPEATLIVTSQGHPVGTVTLLDIQRFAERAQLGR